MDKSKHSSLGSKLNIAKTILDVDLPDAYKLTLTLPNE